MTRLRLANLRNARHFDPGESNPLRAVSAAFHGGETVSVTGASGSGKTLLLRAISDLDPVTGEVYLNDRERCEFSGPDWRRQVGYVAAQSAWWRARVGDHFDSSEVPFLEALGLSRRYLERRVDGLSTGERQRLAIVRALARQPSALLLDEPTAALDTDNAARVERVVADYRARNKCVVIWVSHDSGQARRVARRYLEIRGGGLDEGS